jgi:segregation and condensation protein B
MDDTEIKHFLEAALLAAGRPLNIDQLQNLFDGRMAPEKSEIRKAIAKLNDEYEMRGITIGEVASGFRVQVKATMADRLQKLWEDRPPRYSRALFETLALIAYRQPITRGEIEEVRGVSVSSNIMRSLVEREWVRVVGHRDVPGRPAMFATTRAFLDYFDLKKLDDLPPLADLSDWESLRVQLNLPAVEEDEGIAMPEIPELPVLYPEIGDEENEDESDDIESAYDKNDVENIEDIENVEELLVSEWPNPAASSTIAVIDPEREKDADNDTSASGG